VQDGRAGAAAIDAVTWRMLEAEGRAGGLRVAGVSAPSPGMTFITRAGADPAPYRAALDAALGALDANDRARLGLRANVPLPPAAYDLPIPPEGLHGA